MKLNDVNQRCKEEHICIPGEEDEPADGVQYMRFQSFLYTEVDHLIGSPGFPPLQLGERWERLDDPRAR
jgi:hypothetical protein